jgi:hypothetical protein
MVSSKRRTREPIRGLSRLPTSLRRFGRRGIVRSFLIASAIGTDVAQFTEMGFERCHRRGSFCCCLLYVAPAFRKTPAMEAQNVKRRKETP